MPPPPQPDAAPVASFRCLDAQEQAGVLTGWNQAYWQLSRGAFAGAVDAVSVDGAYVFLESANRALLQRGCLALGAFAVAVPIRLGGAARFCGTTCSLDQAYVYSGRDGFEFCSPADHQVAGIALAPDLVAAVAGARGHPLLPDAAAAQAHVRSADPLALNTLRQLVVGLIDAFSSNPVLVTNRHARAALKDAIIANVCDLLEEPGQVVTPRIHLRGRWAMVARARELIEANPHEPITVAELCSRLDVSRRTLQYCFQDVLGMRPIAYLRAMRLNRARQALQSASSVTDAALDWGFWHLGQFAADYRQMFGERPSETLQNARRGGTR